MLLDMLDKRNVLIVPIWKNIHLPFLVELLLNHDVNQLAGSYIPIQEIQIVSYLGVIWCLMRENQPGHLIKHISGNSVAQIAKHFLGTEIG